MIRISSLRTPGLRSVLVVASAWGIASTCAAEKRPTLATPHDFSVTTAEGQRPYAHLDDTNTAVEDGAVEVVRERYPDGNVKIERCVILDADGNYVNHGAWKLFTAKGDVNAEGQFDMGQRVGIWTRYFGREDAPALNEFPYKKFKAPFMAQANFVNGVIDGEWTIEDADKRKVEQISFQNGERNGSLITWQPNGKAYRQATFDHGVPVGDVMEVNSKNGEMERSATYVDGRKIVTKTNYYKNTKQKKSEELFLAATTIQKSADDFWNMRFAEYTTQGKDLRHGPARSWYADGKPEKEGSYQFDQKSGTFTYWHENGQISSTGEFKNDKPEGLWVWYHENGQKSAVGSYREGTLFGDWRWWNDQGKLTQHKAYDGTESVSSQDQNTYDVGQRTDEDSTVR